MSKFLNQKFLTKRLLVDYFSLLVMDIDGGYPRTKRILFLVPSVGRRPSLLGQISGNLRGARIAVVNVNNNKLKPLSNVTKAVTIVCVLERYACDTTARAQGLLMSNVTVMVRKDCHMSFNS